jgi:hypothetical protein
VSYRLRGFGDATLQVVQPVLPTCKAWEGLTTSAPGVATCAVGPASLFLLPATLLGIKAQDMLSSNQILVSGGVWAGLAFLLFRGSR